MNGPIALLPEASYPTDAQGHDWKGRMIRMTVDGKEYFANNSWHPIKKYQFRLICQNCGYVYNPEDPIRYYPFGTCDSHVVRTVHDS